MDRTPDRRVGVGVAEDIPYNNIEGDKVIKRLNNSIDRHD
jgi:hypothetical protein